MQTDERTRRMADVLARRLATLRCAIEAVYHRHNISAMLRTCDAVGVHHVHLVAGQFFPSKGAARGAERWLAVHEHAGAEAAIGTLRDAGFSLWVAHLAEGGIPPEEVPVDRPLCLWFGAEVEGVSEVARRAADGVVTIPMRGFAQSLNVSVAAALTLRPVAERIRTAGGAVFLPEAERAAVLESWMARDESLRRGIERRASLDFDLPEG